MLFSPSVQSSLRKLDSWRALHWVILVLSVLAVGPLCSLPIARLEDLDGGHAVSMLTSANMLQGVLAGCSVLASAMVVGVLGALCCSAGVGYAASGMVLAWGAWRTASIDAIVRRTRSAEDFPRLAIEGGLVVLWAMLISYGIMYITRAVARQRAGTSEKNTIDGPLAWLLHSSERNVSPARVVAITAGACTLVVALVAAIVCVTTLKGQAVLAAMLAGIAAGWVSQLVARSMHCTPSPTLVVMSFLLPAIAGPLVGQAMHGSNITSEMFAGELFPLARLMPFDWACGALLGVPVGLSWAGEMIDQRAAQD